MTETRPAWLVGPMLRNVRRLSASISELADDCAVAGKCQAAAHTAAEATAVRKRLISSPVDATAYPPSRRRRYGSGAAIRHPGAPDFRQRPAIRRNPLRF